MADLREALEDGGFADVRTYLQSGNVVLTSRAGTDSVRRKCEQLIAKSFGLEIAVVVRSREELAEVVKRNPLGKIAKNPKRYQVSFLAAKPDREVTRELEAAAAPKEQFVVIGREIYAWHPDTIRQSKLWALLAGPKLGVAATARNWTTVTKLLELADA
jgi:uncharacterized protein (DUF1697 family)